MLVTLQQKINTLYLVTKGKNVVRVYISVAIFFIILFLFGIFRLSAWGELIPWHHGIQHVIILISGIGIGSSTVLIMKSKSANNEC